ncbi:MAG: 3-deoxy-7-phosphoheptulonate synthase [Gemmatimonadota bacterium]
MIVVTEAGATPADIERICGRIEELGLTPHVSRGENRTVIGCVGEEARRHEAALRAVPGVRRIVLIETPYKLTAREFAAGPSRIRVGEAEVGGDRVEVIAGPCSVEGADMLRTVAGAVREAGASMLRGGAFKPRTSPYSFRGLGAEALDLLAAVREETGLPVVTEVVDTRHVEEVAERADVLQVGARNMQNFALLTAVGDTRRPILLKRGMSATVRDLLLAAEYVASRGNGQIILCERGIRTYETATRFTFDLAAIPVLKRETHLPVIADPSHAAGDRDLVPSLAYAAVAAGADGLIVEVHPEPSRALSDGDQSLTLEGFAALMAGLSRFAAAAGRRLGPAGPASA